MTRRTPSAVAAFTLGVLLLAGCGASGADPAATSSPSDPTTAAASTAAAEVTVVASTSWVGAFAELAGASVTTLAPADLQHPPDYDPRPSDLRALTDADLVVLGGFEGFAEQMREAVGSDAETLEVDATNTLHVIEEEVMRIADHLGTAGIATANLEGFTAEVQALQDELRAGLGGGPTTVVTHQFMQPWAQFAGLEVVGTYGPAPMSPAELQELVALAPDAVIDNAHVPGGAALAEELGIPIVATSNFPGPGEDLIDVFRGNTELLLTTFGGAR